jgi:myo-inositol-1(or 4)-monophosphatase
MSPKAIRQTLDAATTAARAAGELMRTHRYRTKKINRSIQYDIKLELDVRSQRLITKTLSKLIPGVPVLGEEGFEDVVLDAEARWVVDPIDGTVNYAYGIPHSAVSIAFQERNSKGEFKSTVGVIYDPFMDELWSASQGGKTRMNGKVIQTSSRKRLEESIVSLGFAQSELSLKTAVSQFANLTPRVRKLRIMGSAALALAYVADGRFDAYLETGVRLWDVAAGELIVACAGGKPGCTPMEGDHYYSVHCHNGLLGPELAAVART